MRSVEDDSYFVDSLMIMKVTFLLMENIVQKELCYYS